MKRPRCSIIQRHPTVILSIASRGSDKLPAFGGYADGVINPEPFLPQGVRPDFFERLLPDIAEFDVYERAWNYVTIRGEITFLLECRATSLSPIGLEVGPDMGVCLYVGVELCAVCSSQDEIIAPLPVAGRHGKIEREYGAEAFGEYGQPL
jgi:hypothetical protein